MKFYIQYVFVIIIVFSNCDHPLDYEKSNKQKGPTGIYKDINGDGYADIVFANYKNEGDFEINSYIYWGSTSGFSTSNRTDFPTVGAEHIDIYDLNLDGHMDIIVSNFLKGGTQYSIDSYIYWGSATDYSISDRTELLTHGVRKSEIADLDKDGYPDIIFCNYRNDTGSYSINSYIYWGSANGYSTYDRTDLFTIGAKDVVVINLDNDEYLDIIFANYRISTTDHSVNSYVYWGSANGYSASDKTDLPTNGANDVSILDYNKDGYTDIVFANYFNDTSYSIDSYIYWSDSSGNFSSNNRTGLPVIGAKYVY